MVNVQLMVQVCNYFLTSPHAENLNFEISHTKHNFRSLENFAKFFLYHVFIFSLILVRLKLITDIKVLIIRGSCRFPNLLQPAE